MDTDKKLLVIVKPNGRASTLGEYVRSWRKLQTVEPDTDINGWDWFPTSARSILCDIRAGIHDRINKRGKLLLQPTRRALIVGHNPTITRDSTTLERERDRRFFRRAVERAIVYCRYCGVRIPFNNRHPRCCAHC